VRRSHRCRWGLGALAIALFGVAEAAPKKTEPVTPAQLDNPCVDQACKRHALDHFSEALANQKAGKSDRPLRISYFGDSVTADDHIVHALREKLGAAVGMGGPGFVFAAKPHPYNHNYAVQHYAAGGWQVHGISSAVPADRLLGLGGSAEGSGVIRMVPASSISSVDVHYLAQPGGGLLEVVADNAVVETFSTAADRKSAAFKKVTIPAATKKVELRAKSRVRLFGAALEATKGVVVDNLGIVNATAKGMVKFNAADHLRAQLAHRSSDLVIVMFGTNEAEWLIPKGANMAEHEKVMDELLAAVRGANPNASCLVISPLDQLDWRQENAPPRASIPAMVDVQRRSATSHGCAFWNTYQWMGGKGSSASWYRRGLVIKDFQHPTSEGAMKIAEALFAGLVR
jgi:lysophospholipase L1-like esterase